MIDTPISLPHRRAVLACAALLFGVAPALAAPSNLDRSLDRMTDHGLFRIRLRSGANPIPMSQIHRWDLTLTGANGKPVSGAVIAVDGGMPEHGHGLPTAPKCAPEGAPGAYVISGMKFSMTGWWVIKLAVSAPDGRADTITFNLVL